MQMVKQIDFSESKSIWDDAYKRNDIHAPFFDWRWHNDWFSILADGWNPYTLLTDDDIIVPFARKESECIWSGGEEIADYLDIIGSSEKKSIAWDHILTFLKQENITSLSLRNIPQNSPTISFFRNLESTIIKEEDTTPQLSLPSSWDIYTESLSKKHRHELERKIRKFNREYPDGQIIQSTHPSGDIHILLDLMEKDEDKKIFLTPTMELFFQKITETFSQDITLRYIALGDKKIAATMGFITGGVTYLYNSGFDKECCANAGFYLKAMNLQHAIDNNIHTYNFLQGNERYKYELGAADFFVYSVHWAHQSSK